MSQGPVGWTPRSRANLPDSKEPGDGGDGSVSKEEALTEAWRRGLCAEPMPEGVMHALGLKPMKVQEAPAVKTSALDVRAGWPASIKERLDKLLEEKGVRRKFPKAVLQEVDALVKSPQIDDPTLVDMTDLDFLTIDNDDSRDLDQAMQIEERPDGGYRVRYALADGGHYILPGTELYEEAKKRGVTFYMPGYSVPMLAEALSEGVISLNENVDRRAMVLTMDVDASGNVTKTDVCQARIRSRGKLSYSGVQKYYDDPASSPLSKRPELTSTLDLLPKVGRLRIWRRLQKEASEAAAERGEPAPELSLEDVEGMRQLNRREVSIGIDPNDPTRFLVTEKQRYAVESFNEQISLMCNEEAAKLLTAPTNDPDILPVFRVHDMPPHSRVRALEARVAAAIENLGLDKEKWGWNRKKESLQAYLSRLPDDKQGQRFVEAIERQSIMVNLGAEFTTEAGAHHGTGAEAYVRASSPMRQMVGIDTLQTLWEKVTGVKYDGQAHADEIVDIATNSQKLAREIDREVYKMVLDQYFSDETALPKEDRRTFPATVLGLTKTKVYLRFDDPPLELKIHRADFEEACDVAFVPDEEGAAYLSSHPDRAANIVLGGRLDVRLASYDEDQKRYKFELAK